MLKHTHLLLLSALLTAPLIAQAQETNEAPPGEASERQLSTEEPFMNWSRDPRALETEGGDRLEQREVLSEHAKIVKLKNVVPPIRFESGVADIPPS